MKCINQIIIKTTIIRAFEREYYRTITEPYKRQRNIKQNFCFQHQVIMIPRFSFRYISSESESCCGILQYFEERERERGKIQK